MQLEQWELKIRYEHFHMGGITKPYACFQDGLLFAEQGASFFRLAFFSYSHELNPSRVKHKVVPKLRVKPCRNSGYSKLSTKQLLSLLRTTKPCNETALAGVHVLVVLFKFHGIVTAQLRLDGSWFRLHPLLTVRLGNKHRLFLFSAILLEKRTATGKLIVSMV